MITSEILRMLDAHIEYAENTNNFHNLGNFVAIKNKIVSLESCLDSEITESASLEVDLEIAEEEIKELKAKLRRLECH